MEGVGQGMLHIPGLARNLIFVSKMNDARVHTMFDRDACKKERRDKLGMNAVKCIFIRYKDGVKGYKLWNPVTRTTIYSRRDMVFKEVKDI